jgi:hypothetical protein
MRDLDHPILASAKNTNNWKARKGDLQCAFPLDVLMVPSSALAVATDGERLSYDVFSLDKTIHFGSLEFIADRVGDLSLSSMGDDSDAAVMRSTRGRPPSPLQAMTWDFTKEFHMTSDGEGRIDLPSPRRHGMGASTTPATTISWPEGTLTTQAMVIVPP